MIDEYVTQKLLFFNIYNKTHDILKIKKKIKKKMKNEKLQLTHLWFS